ncbi:MAG: flavodoxin [Firmicutes bacterium]|nr:flavodoxin [Bacillota bacterium]
MERTIVIYKSKYGATEQYARWIAEELDCDLVRAEDFKARNLDNYDNIIYGGGLQAGGIKGFDLIRKNRRRLEGKKVVIFVVGLSVDDKENRMEVRDINLDKKELKGLTLYYCKGAFKPEAVSGIDKGIIKVCLNMLEPHRFVGTDAQKQLYKDMTEGANYVDKKYIEPIVAEFRQK